MVEGVEDLAVALVAALAAMVVVTVALLPTVAVATEAATAAVVATATLVLLTAHLLGGNRLCLTLHFNNSPLIPFHYFQHLCAAVPLVEYSSAMHLEHLRA